MKTANEKKSFTNESVVRLSQELDVYLFEFQRRSKEACRRRKVLKKQIEIL
ncbi:aspartyl-phosphate phosphatase Spo0E family protein [Paenibacillus alvei]|uniref:Aspartyl-phosphate phosphatase Spo0E family protein n=1 Tax=Paenibacillus alvei TaxID=44250 RepID=A0ABT4H4B3_PAEAL|nr:aspartyl-phosphate phosphatase Spo0E family protein [Paenibacillus alvei]MCY9541689.1 aspartyl-phosphate phosphatase Spo0E family protein [Paenibacillus alvei]MCY9704175.1 aspartyl-phosphate phosphatase Spo0E family protein [Paenibacillus alvei]MCY9736902.1 aspartyl-phosphate phosphatase Spo0E family protein [Paenibacillus alvei]MCY9755658.1 aspartyl-phosphate phosphatase Spo0E family protein [Paenibacillus alvei]